MPDLNMSYAFGLKPKEAIKYFTDKGARLTWDYTEMLNEAHAKEFTVAKVMRNDILADIHGALLKAKDEGRPYSEFLKELRPTLKAKGWWGRHESIDPSTGEVINVQLGSPRRLKTIYQTNLQSAYMAGHYKQNMKNASARPIWRYVAVMDRKTRPAHAALNGLEFRFDDPFWDTHHPENGYGCRCTVRTLADDQADPAAFRSTRGKNPTATLTDEVVEVGKDKVPTTVTRMSTTDLLGRKVSMAPDPGFNFNPGKIWQKPFVPPPLDVSPAVLPALKSRPSPPLRKPERVSRKLLLPDGWTPEAYYAKFLSAFPVVVQKSGVFHDVTDEPVLLTEDLFQDNQGNWKITKRGRHQTLPLLAMTIIDPDEIWMFMKSHGPKGSELRRRYLKRFVIAEDGKEIPVVGIFEQGKSGWVGETIFPVEQKTSAQSKLYFEKMRGDYLQYRKENGP